MALEFLAAAFISDACGFYSTDLKPLFQLKGRAHCRLLGPNEMLVVEEERVLKRVSIENGKIAGTRWSTPLLAHHDLAISPDRKRVATLGSRFEMLGGRRMRFDTVEILNLESGELERTWSTHERLSELKGLFGTKLKAPVYKKDYGRDYVELFHLNSVDFIGTDRLVVSFGRHRHVALFSIGDKLELTKLIEVPGEGMSHAARSFDGSIFVYSNEYPERGDGPAVLRMDLEGRKFSEVPLLKGSPIRAPRRGNLAFSADGRRILVSNPGGEILEFELKSGSRTLNKRISFKEDGYPDADFYQLYYAR